jgi:hypothetical protein
VRERLGQLLVDLVGMHAQPPHNRAENSSGPR